MRTKFTSLIHNTTPHSIQYIPKQQLDILDVSINLYTDTSMFYKHKTMLQTVAYTNSDALMNTIKAICNYINIYIFKKQLMFFYLFFQHGLLCSLFHLT